MSLLWERMPASALYILDLKGKVRIFQIMHAGKLNFVYEWMLWLTFEAYSAPYGNVSILV